MVCILKIAMQARVEQLEGGIRGLKDKLAVEVASRQEELQEQATSLRDADGAIQVRILVGGGGAH